MRAHFVHEYYNNVSLSYSHTNSFSLIHYGCKADEQKEIIANSVRRTHWLATISSHLLCVYLCVSLCSCNTPSRNASHYKFAPNIYIVSCVAVLPLKLLSCSFFVFVVVAVWSVLCVFWNATALHTASLSRRFSSSVTQTLTKYTHCWWHISHCLRFDSLYGLIWFAIAYTFYAYISKLNNIRYWNLVRWKLGRSLLYSRIKFNEVRFDCIIPFYPLSSYSFDVSFGEYVYWRKASGIRIIHRKSHAIAFQFQWNGIYILYGEIYINGDNQIDIIISVCCRFVAVKNHISRYTTHTHLYKYI